MSLDDLACALREIKELRKILHPLIIEYYKDLIYSTVRSKEKQFRKDWIIYSLENYHVFRSEISEAFDELVKDGEILEGSSSGWYMSYPNLIFDLKEVKDD